MKVNVFWFRRDLRLHDNHGLYRALHADLPVLPLFIFDDDIITTLDEKSDLRLSFIYKCIWEIQVTLRNYGSSLLVKRGKPVDIFKDLIKDFSVVNVFTNHDYEPYAIKRDNKISALLRNHDIGFHTFKDQVIFEKNDIVKKDGKPYTVFTPYQNAWRMKLKDEEPSQYLSELLIDKFIKTNGFIFPEMHCPDYRKIVFPKPDLRILILEKYKENRDFPAKNATTKISLYLRFGKMSIRELVLKAKEQYETWLNELIWREFFMQILYHFPHVVSCSFKPVYDNIEWRKDEKDFKRWCDGETGYPLVDAGMRELNTTGTMHNRVRMIVASFLSKHLLIDWRWGEAYFASRLLDFELSSNNGNWQWAAGTGCDAVPYFRIFNPITQAEKYDFNSDYIKKWVPEIQTGTYTKPIVEHNYARQRCIETYKKALKS